MLRQVLGGLAAFSLASSALAFTGNSYVGVGVGGSNFNDTISINNTSGTTPELGHLGFVGGLFGGYNFLFCNNFNLGLEAFGNGSTASASLTDANTGGQIVTRSRYNYGVRALPGYKFTADSVGYLIAGYAQGNFRFTDSGAATAAGASSTFSRPGYQVGLGGSTSLNQHFSVRGDLIYTGYSGQTVHANSGPIQYNNHDMNTFDGLVSLVYKFA